MPKKLTVIDLFCGAGGMSEGFTQAGFKVLAGIEYINVFAKTFQKNHKNAKTINKDIREITVAEIKKEISNLKVDVITGGPPCQGFSAAGRRDTKDPRNSLFMEFVRIVEGFKPKYFVMENVPGILTMKTHSGEYVVDIIEREFSKIGYKLEKKKLIAADYGVPQIRKRVIFIGTNKKLPITYPEPTHIKNGHDAFFNNGFEKWVGVETVLHKKEEVAKSFFHGPKMIEGFLRRREYNDAKGNGFGWQILEKGKPSFTISARYWKDGSDALVKYSENEIRMLTPRECAKIQSFPDSFEFVGSKKDIYTQIGNAVPPKLAYAIAIELKKQLYKNR